MKLFGMRRGRRARRHGFSLVEIMVCMGILSLALLAVLSASVTSTSVSTQTRATTEAAGLMNDVLERLRSIGASKITTELTSTWPSNQFGLYTTTGNKDSFTISGTVSGRPTALTGTLVECVLLTDAQTNTNMATDLDADATFGEDPADVQQLAASGAVRPIQITVTYPILSLSAGGKTGNQVNAIRKTRLMRCFTALYPTNT